MVKVRTALAAVTLATTSLTACATVPVTGRHQLLLLPESQEQQMGLDAYRQVLKKAKLSTDPVAIEQVRRVGRRIAEATGRTDYQWEFNLIEDKQANAFCLPGGKVAVYTGILPITRDDLGLAAVLGPEYSHATARPSTCPLTRRKRLGSSRSRPGSRRPCSSTPPADPQ